MDRIKRSVENLKAVKGERVSQDKLEEEGLHGIVLREYQLDGISWITRCHDCDHGCILGDEMGLGKTIQVISVLLHLKKSQHVSGPFLILAPLSVLDNWKKELRQYARVLKVITLIGSKEDRESVKSSVSKDRNNKNGSAGFDILLTSYEICLRETYFLCKFDWSVLGVDEAHRLKNSNSLLYQELLEFKVDFSILLTGTPVQNNLKELYSLLSFVAPLVFPLDLMQDFVEAFEDITSQSSGASSLLQKLLSPFLLRRVKAEVMIDLPEKSEVILYAGMSEIQKKYYKAILTKDLGLFSNDGANRTRLNNILVHLRKCVNHPYLFDGVEPEPFQLGEHLVTASGKLHAIDQLLTYLQNRGHKVLLFSQMTRMLDIIQDYCGYRGFTYERLDGSVRGEERYLAIKNFNEEQDTFLFLLSTRAGGQGLNLMSADTVIFVDNDYNPQNDLQAAARAHRLGQTRPVKIIRLVCRNTVEEIILKRADDKLKLTNNVIEGGQFSGSGINQVAETNMQLADILKFGLDKLFNSEDSAITDQEFDRILGDSRDGEWVVETAPVAPEKDDYESVEQETSQADNMYVYEGKDYSKGASNQDVAAFDRMVADILEEVKSAERSLRSLNRAPSTSFPDLTTRKRKVLTEEEVEQRRLKRKEAAAKRAKLKEEEEERKEQERKRRLEKLWRDNNYSSRCIVREESDDEGSGSENDDMTSSDDEKRLDIQYVRGDVTHPMNTRGRAAIVVHCVDDSGYWGHGGLFTAISRRSPKPQEAYEFAGEMKDLHLGNAHLIPFDDSSDSRELLALIVAQTRDRHNRLSPIDLSALSDGLLRVAQEARHEKASVHLPRIGHSTPGFNWYGTERLIRKHLASRGIPTSIYYYPRKGVSAVSSTDINNDIQVDSDSSGNSCTASGGKSMDKTRKDQSESGGRCPRASVEERCKTVHPLPVIFTGVTVYFHGLEEETEKKMRRYVIAFNGDVEKTFSSDVTHVVCSEPPPELSDEFQDNFEVVTTTWLEQCFKKRRLVDTARYKF